MFSHFVFHLFNNQKRRGKSKTIIIDFTFLDFFNSVKIGVLNVQRCKILCEQKYANINELIHNFDEKCNHYQQNIFYPTVCKILSQGEEIRTNKYKKHNFIVTPS